MKLKHFPIGVYMQPATNFAKWKGRGCNLIVTDRQKPDNPAPARSLYINQAKSAGLDVIIGNGVVDDKVESNLLAWGLPDEPENWPHVVKNPDGSFNWDKTIDGYQQQLGNFRVIGPGVPLHGNFNGGPLGSARETDLNPKNVTLGHYRRFTANLDLVSADFYIRPQGRPPEHLSNYGKIQDRLKLVAPSALPLAVVECCDQGLTNNNPASPPAAPTATEVKAAIWIALIHGAQGIIYFPLKVGGGFLWDNTPVNVAAVMPDIHAEIVKYEKVILEGQRIKSPTAEEAVWNHPDGSHLHATASFNTTTKVWTVTIEGNVVQVDPEKEALRQQLNLANAKLDNYKKWLAQAPQ